MAAKKDIDILVPTAKHSPVFVLDESSVLSSEVPGIGSSNVIEAAIGRIRFGYLM